MRPDPRMRALATLALTMLVSVAAAQAPTPEDPPGDALLLTQSELDYLEAGSRRVTIEVKRDSPTVTLEKIRKKTQLEITVKGTLPEKPKLTATFREATVREVLKWFAAETGVVYRVDRGDKLSVFPPPRKADP